MSSSDRRRYERRIRRELTRDAERVINPLPQPLAHPLPPDYFQTLPEEIIHTTLPSQLAPEALGVLPRVNQFFCSLFQMREEPTKANLIAQFGIRGEVIARLEKLRAERKITFNYRQLLKGRFRLFRKEIKERYLQHLLADERYQFLVLASCANDSSFDKWIFENDSSNFIKLSVYAGSHVFDAKFLRKFIVEQRREFFEFVIRDGSIAAARVCISFAIEEGIEEIDRLLAVFLEYYCGTTSEDTRSQKFDVIPDLLAIFVSNRTALAKHYQQMFEACVLAGNVRDVFALLELAEGDDRSQRNETPFLKLTDDLLTSAAKSANKEMLLVLLRLNRHAHVNLKSLLDSFADKGMLDAVHVLLALRTPDSDEPLVVPDNNTLDRAASSGNLVLFLFLFDLKTPDGQPLLNLRPSTLQLAFHSDNVEIVRIIVAVNKALLLRLDLTFIFYLALEGKKQSHEKSFDIANEILSYRHRGAPVVNLPRAISEIVRYGNVQLLHTLLPFYSDQSLDLQKDLPPEAFTAAIYSNSCDMVRKLLTLKNIEGQPLFVPTLEHLRAAIQSDNPEMPFELLTLRDTQGNPLLIPTVAELNAAIFAGDLRLVYALLAYDGTDVRPFIELDRDSFRNAITLGNVELILDLLTHSRLQMPTKLQHMFDALQSRIFRENKTKMISLAHCLAKLFSVQNAISRRDFKKAETCLKEAYRFSPFYFSEEITKMLEKPTSFLIEFLKKFITEKRDIPELPLCELELLDVMNEKLSAAERKFLRPHL